MFFDFYEVNMSTKAKLTVNFKTWQSCNHIHFLQNTLFLLKSVGANLIYLENDKLQNIGKTV